MGDASVSGSEVGWSISTLFDRLDLVREWAVAGETETKASPSTQRVIMDYQVLDACTSPCGSMNGV